MDSGIKCLLVGILLHASFIHVCCFKIYVQNDVSSLELVHIIFRHGDRTPVEPYPNDPYKNISYWPVGWGQLTNEGKREHYHLGQFFRRRYSGFLNSMYMKEEVHVRSTDVDRTLMSAEANLAGLYTPSGNQIWETGVTWQPIPVHTIPEVLDRVLAGKKPCPRYEEEEKKLKKLPLIQKLNEENQHLYEYLTKMTGKYIHDIVSVEYLYNTLFIEKRYNFTLPEWTESVYPDKMRYLASFSFTLPAYTKEMQRLKMGPLIGEILDHLLSKKDGTLSPPQRKLFMYSAHDTTVANLMMSFGVFDPPFSPPYTATLLLELHKSANGDHYVSLLYKNGTEAEDVILLTIPGCLQQCPLDRFEELMRPIIPADWKTECSTVYDGDTTIDILGSSARLPMAEMTLIDTEKCVGHGSGCIMRPKSAQCPVVDGASHHSCWANELCGPHGKEPKRCKNNPPPAAVVMSSTTALLLVIALVAMLSYWCRRHDSPHWYYKLNTQGP